MKSNGICKECTAEVSVCEYCEFNNDKELNKENKNIINFNNNKYDGKSKKFCPVCKKVYTSYPSISRKDNKTLICSECGIKEIQEPFEELLYEHNIFIE